MGLRDTARKSFDEARKQRTEMPWWLPRVGIIACVIAALVVLFTLNSGHEVSAPVTSNVPAAIVPGQETEAQKFAKEFQEEAERRYNEAAAQGGAVPTTRSSGGSTGPTTTNGNSVPSSGAAVVVEATDGSKVTVPQQAYDLAVGKAVTSGATLVSALVQSASSQAISMIVTVDPDGNGAQAPRVEVVRVAKDGDRWTVR